MNHNEIHYNIKLSGIAQTWDFNTLEGAKHFITSRVAILPVLQSAWIDEYYCNEPTGTFFRYDYETKSFERSI